MDLQLTLAGRGRLWADVYRQLRAAILEGRLPPGSRLPATRVLGGQLGVSRNTVLGAYQRLIAEGFLSGSAGRGTFVSGGAPEAAPRAPAGAGLRPLPFWSALVDQATPPTAPAPFDFRLGAPDPRLFPWDEWRRLLAHQLRGRRPIAGYPPPGGDGRLRSAVVRYLAASRAVQAGPEDVLVCAGAQQAIDLVGRVLLEPGAVVAVEDPGYPPLRQALASRGARVVPVPVDAEGLRVAALPEAARLVCVTPSHQFPLGTPMSLPRRLELLAWCARRGAVILEDDYDSEFRFDGRSLEPLQSLDRHGRVLFVGTFSKVLLPTLRLGYLVAPPSLMPALRAARALQDSHGPPEPQRALAEFMESGLFSRHLRRLQRVYRARHERVAEAVGRRLGGVLERISSAAGLHLAARCRDPGLDVLAWLARAREAGVAIEPLQRYRLRSGPPGLAFGYGLIAEERIEEGIERLAAALPGRGEAG